MAKPIEQKIFPPGQSIPSYFDKQNVDATVRDQSYDCLYEKSQACPCKSQSSTHLNNCKNCGGTGWLFPNTLQTRFVITGIGADNKLKEAAFREWGNVDTGSVTITGYNEEKFTYMDRITMLDATAEHNELLYPSYTDSDTNQFAFTQYKIKDVYSLLVFVAHDQPLQKLEDGVDYTFRENIIELSDSFVNENMQLSIRYVHHPVFHITDIIRESLTSKKGQMPTGQETLKLPIKAIAKRAHLILDVQNYTGDRLLDNSWLPNVCETPSLTDFQRQVKYTAIETLYSYLTNKQKQALEELLSADS